MRPAAFEIEPLRIRVLKAQVDRHQSGHDGDRSNRARLDLVVLAAVEHASVFRAGPPPESRSRRSRRDLP